MTLTTTIAGAVTGLLLTAAVYGQELRRPVVAIAGFLDESGIPAPDKVKELRTLLEENLRKSRRVQYQPDPDLKAVNSIREFAQLAAPGSEAMDKVKAQGVNDLVFLNVTLQMAGGAVNNFNALILNVETRELSGLFLGTYANRAATAAGVDFKKVKLIAQGPRAAARAAELLCTYITTENRAARDLIYEIENTRRLMAVKNYGKAFALTLAGAGMAGGLWFGGKTLEESLAAEDKAEAKKKGVPYEAEPHGLVGALQVLSPVFAFPAALGAGLFFKRMGLGFRYGRLTEEYKMLTGQKYVLSL